MHARAVRVLAVTMGCAMGCGAVSAVDGMATVDLTDVAPAGSPGQREAVAYLVAHPWHAAASGAAQQAMPASPDLGDLRLSYHATRSVDVPAAGMSDSVPSAPPSTGNHVGDQWRAEACDAGRSLRWTYRYEALPDAGWHVRSFRMKRDDDCNLAAD